MIVKLLTEHHLEYLSLNGSCRGSSESTLFKMSNCWKSYAVESILSSLQLGKTTGPDAINNRILKELKDVISAPLCDLLNTSLSPECLQRQCSKYMEGSN